MIINERFNQVSKILKQRNRVASNGKPLLIDRNIEKYDSKELNRLIMNKSFYTVDDTVDDAM